MEFSVTKSALLNELTTTQGVVERKTTIPILSNLLVEAKGSRVTITATDLELSVRTSCEATVKKEGAGTSRVAPEVEDQQDRGPGRDRAQHADHGLEQPIPVGLGLRGRR